MDWHSLSDADRAALYELLENRVAREPLAEGVAPLAQFLRRAGAFFEPTHEETQYTDWNGAPVGTGPGAELRAAIPPDPTLPFDALAPLLELGRFARALVGRHPATPDDVLLALAADEEEVIQIAVAERSMKSDAVRSRLAASTYPGVRWRLASDAQLTPRQLVTLARDPDSLVRRTIARRADVPAELLSALAESDWTIALEVADNPSTPRDLLAKLLAKLADHPDMGARRFVAKHPQAPPDVLAHLTESTGDAGTHELIAANPSTPPDALGRLFAEMPARVAAHPKLPGDLAPACARHENPNVRVAFAGNPGADGALLATLVEDPSVYVRLALAENRAFSALADLATDGNVDVRVRVARRPDATDDVRRALVRDEDARVRAQAQESIAQAFATQAKGPVRSSAEMTFAASLQSCAKCGAAIATGFLSYGAQGRDCWLWGTCRDCGAGLSFSFTHDRDDLLAATHPPLELGGPEPSRVIAPARFKRELDRLTALIGDDSPEPLRLDDWVVRSARIDRVLTCLLELHKFPVAEQPRDLAERHARMLALKERYVADAPRTWLLRGGVLAAADEIQALRNQAPSSRQVTASDIQRWLAVRSEHMKDGAARAIRVWEDDIATYAEIALARGTVAEVAEVLGKLETKSAMRRAADTTFARHRIHAQVECVHDDVSKVTLRFIHESRPDAPPPPIAAPSKIRELFERKLAQADRELEEATREAHASGKEPLDCAKMRALAGLGNASDHEIRTGYYVLHPEVRSMAEYAAFLAKIAPWEDSR